MIEEKKAYYLPCHEIEVGLRGISIYHHDPGSIFRSPALIWRISMYRKLPMAPNISFHVLDDVRTGTDIWTMIFGCH